MNVYTFARMLSSSSIDKGSTELVCKPFSKPNICKWSFVIALSMFSLRGVPKFVRVKLTLSRFHDPTSYTG